MITITFDDKTFMKEIQNVLAYSSGFVDGVKSGKISFLEQFSDHAIESAGEYFDASARVNPAGLQHMYEWNQNGAESGRLFDLSSLVSSRSITVSASFRQSTSVKPGSKEPFVNKAFVMESGIPVTITPKESSVLAFTENGETVFTKKSVTIENPGGLFARQGFEKAFNQFFNVFFSQSFLKSGKLGKYLSDVSDYHNAFASAKTGGRSLGKSVGYKWISKAGSVA
jgi:hypothetical protein